MVILLVLLLLATLFMMVAMILSDALFRTSTLHQDLIWRSTLFAIVLLPGSVMVQSLVPGIALPIRSWEGTPGPLVQNSPQTPDTATPSSAQAHPEVLPREKPSLSLEPEKQLTVSSKPPANPKPTERQVPRSDLSPRVPVSRSIEPVEAPSTPTKVATNDPSPSVAQAIAIGFVGVWVFGSILRWSMLTIGWIVQMRRTSLAQFDPSSLWCHVADRIASPSKRTRCRIGFSPQVDTPMLVGLRSPVILVPEWMRTIEDRALVRQVLMHEMAHLERGDHWTNVLLQWVGGMLWMHPLYYWMRRRILMLREVICDVRVLEDFDPLSYSETLLNLARQSSVRRWESAALGVAMPKSLLGRRITFLLNHSPKQQPIQLNNGVRRCVWSAALLIPFASGLIQVQAAPKSMDPSVVELQGDGVQEVHGTVQLPDGKPAKGAKVHLFRTGDGAMTLPVKTETAETDLEGKYRYRNLAVGTYQLWAETDQLTSLNEKLRGMKIELKEGQQKAIVANFTLHEGCRYEVTVWDKEKDVAVPDADISFGWTDIDRHYKTKQNGVVEIGGLAIDEWYFVVKAKGYGIQYRKLPKQPLGSRTPIRFELEPGTDLQGTIRDETGAPVAGARIGATESQGGMNPGYGRTESDAEGRFQLSSMPRGTEIRLSATAEGYLRLSTSVNVPSDLSQLRSDLVMAKRPYGGDCLVKVLNDQGEPISNARIENMGSSSADVRTASTNEDGVARLNDLYTSVLGSNGTVRAAGYIAAQVKLIAGTKEKPGEVTVRLKKGESFRGRLVKPNGEPAPKVWVFYNQWESGFGGLGGRVDTDAEGRFQIDGLPNPSTFSIYTPAPYAPIQGRSLPVGRDEEIEIKMEPEGVIRVRAIDKETGKAIPEFNVRIGFSQDRRPNEPRVTLNSELFDPGKNILGDTKVYRLGQLAPGFGLQVTVSAKGYQRKVLPRLEASIEADSEIVDVELNREDESMFCVVSGRLVDTSGKPVSGALLKLVVGKNKDEGPESALRQWWRITNGQVERDPACLQLLTTTTKSDGSFRFDRVIDGNWKELVHTGGKVASGRFVLRPSDGRSGFEDLNLEAKRAGVVRVVIDRDKFPKVDAIELNAIQNINSVGDMSQTVTAGIKELTFENVAPGSYRVSLCERKSDVGGFFTQKVIQSLQVELDEGDKEEVQFR